MFLRKLGPPILLILLASPSVQAGVSPAMYFRHEGALSPYRFATVAISAEGRLTCEIEYLSQRSTSALLLSKQELSCFRSQFERVLSLPRLSVAKTAVDTGKTTWRMTEQGKTRELNYEYSDNAWCRELSQEMWRIIRRETALLALLPEANKGRSHGAYEVASDLRQARIFRPDSLRAPLLEALGRWPSADASFWSNHGTLMHLLHSLAYAVPPEQWASHVQELYARLPSAARIIMVRTLSNGNFLSDLRDRQGRLLIPLLVKGLEELLTDPQLGTDEQAQQAISEVTIALGNLRDARAIDILSSDRLWALKTKHDPAGWAAKSLTQIGLAGVKALLPKASSPDESTRQVAERALQYAAQFYTSEVSILPPQQGPTAEEASEIRRFLEARGFKQIERGQLPPWLQP